LKKYTKYFNKITILFNDTILQKHIDYGAKFSYFLTGDWMQNKNMPQKWLAVHFGKCLKLLSTSDI